MAKFRIQGGKELRGKITVPGAKNAALKIIPAAILADSPCQISNVPLIIDIERIIEILRSINANVVVTGSAVEIDPRKINSSHPDEKLVKKLRGSVVLAGALLSKFGQAVFSQPGGCLLGARAIDDHLDLFRQLGVKISENNGKFFLKGKPRSGRVVLNKLSVTATENAILSTVLSQGDTHIHVAAAEPEVTDLADFLNKMGAKIEGAGTHDIKVTGVKNLKGVSWDILPDRIQAGTYIMAGVASNSELTVGPIILDHLDLVLKKLEDIGARFTTFEKNGETYLKTLKHKGLIASDIDTRPYPGFPTDLQSPYTVLATQCKGTTRIFETMFEGRFAYIEELKSLRANAQILNPHELEIKGPEKLVGAEISSKDIRGGAALVIAALLAQRETVINDIEFIDRGYEKIDEKLKLVGADIIREE